jgi:hypothetical protein
MAISIRSKITFSNLKYIYNDHFLLSAFKSVNLILTFTIIFNINSYGQEKINYIKILQQEKYSKSASPENLVFEYQSSNDPDLVALRNNFNLDSVAGFGNSQSRILNVLHWVHNNISHNGVIESGIKQLNANEILSFTRIKKRGVSCGELATVLNDSYLALGYKSRKIYCFPKDSLKNDPDSHVINEVYLLDEKKWIMVDPTNDAYVMDELGNMLSIRDVRERLILGKTLIVNPDANWNRRISMGVKNYLQEYMAKNLYRLYTAIKSAYNYESLPIGKRSYITLAPTGYKTDKESSYKNDIVNNPSIFWQVPYK